MVISSGYKLAFPVGSQCVVNLGHHCGVLRFHSSDHAYSSTKDVCAWVNVSAKGGGLKGKRDRFVARSWCDGISYGTSQPLEGLSADWRSFAAIQGFWKGLGAYERSLLPIREGQSVYLSHNDDGFIHAIGNGSPIEA